MKNQTMSSETGYGMTDYSRKTSWYQIPDAAREVDTIYIYATEYIMGGASKRDPPITRRWTMRRCCRAWQAST